MATIDLSNFDTTLVQSTQGRSGTPNGNFFFDKDNGTFELFPSDEVAQVDLGSGLVSNPLDRIDGIKFEAVYAFENQERDTDETLRGLDRWTKGVFRDAGAYAFVNDRKFATVEDEKLIRGSGWKEFLLDKSLSRVFFGNKGLSNIFETSQPSYQLGRHTTSIDFSKPGQIDEAILVYDVNGDDSRDLPEIISLRTYGNTFSRKATDVDLAIPTLGGFDTGFAINEVPHPTTDPVAMPLSDVLTSPTGVWANMKLEKLSTPLVVDEFAGTAGTFSWVITNDDGADLDEIVAWIDAISTSTSDIDSGSETVTIGKDVDVWYDVENSKIIFKSGADELGLYVYNIPVEDRQRLKFIDDNGNEKAYQFKVSINVNVGATAKSDPKAWYQGFGADDFNTSNVITIIDADGNELKGKPSTDANNDNVVSFAFDYDNDTILGSAGTNKNCVFVCEGNGVATQAKTLFTISRTTEIGFSCEPGVENNA